MFSDADVAEFHELAESRMKDRCVIREPSDDTGFDRSTYERTAEPGDIVYEGKCRVKRANLQGSSTEIAGAEWTSLRVELSLPLVASDPVYSGCNVTIVEARYDPDLENRRFRVDDPHHQTEATCRRLPCVELTPR